MSMAGVIFLMFILLMILAAATNNGQQDQQEEIFIVQKITTNSNQQRDISVVELQQTTPQRRGVNGWELFGFLVLVIAFIAWI